MEHGEKPRSQNSFEILSKWAEGDNRVIAAMGFQALAMRANNPTLAATYFNKAMYALHAAEESPLDEGPIPHHTTVLGTAMLHLAPIARELVVHKTISEPETVKEVAGPFIRDLGKHARAAKKLIQAPPPANPELAVKQSTLIAAFNTLAVTGLFMYLQTELMRSSDYMTLPAFLEPECISANPKRPIRRNWHVNVFSGRSSKDFDLTYKIYVRYNSTSTHDRLDDPETSVVWVVNDLSLPTDNFPAVELDIIKDLESKTKRGRDNIEKRLDSLLDVIDTRTFGSLQRY